MFVLGAVLCSLALAPIAGAEPPELLTRLSASGGVPGEGAGRLNNPRGVAVNAENGRTYIADLNNHRISEFTAWGEFVKAWGWGVADGGEELQICGPAEPEEVPPAGLCRSGLEGEGRGQLGLPLGMAVDDEGAIYVVEHANLRVQKFSAEGEFILMFGGEVNETSGGNVCPRPGFPGDVCQKGTAGGAPSHFAGVAVGDYVAFSPAEEAIVVGDEDRIQVFNLDGTYREEIGFEGELGSLAGKSVNGLDVDSAGNIYFSVAGTEDVFKVSSSGEPLAPGVPGASKFKAEVPLGVAADVEGTVWVLDDPPNTSPNGNEARLYAYDPDGNKLIPTGAEEEAGEFFPFVPSGPSGPLYSLTAIATNICAGSDSPGNLYVAGFNFGNHSWVDAYGTPPIGCEPPPERPPHIVSQYATAVGTDSAKLRPEINPRYWADTEYQLEYGPAPCAEGGCAIAPAAAVTLTNQVTSQVLKGAPVAISGLEPGTVYHYRFVAHSGGGGPVFGEHGGEAEKDGEGKTTYREVGEEGSFRTFNAPDDDPPPCANDAFRAGPGAALPDCRAYERVSPADKAGGDVALWRSEQAIDKRHFEIHQSAPTGERFTFTSKRAFADPASALSHSQYLARRGAGGWQSKAINPPLTALTVGTEQLIGNNPFQLFSADLCTAWMRSYSAAPLTEDAIPGYANIYRRDVCASGPYRALSTVEPSNRDPNEYTELRAHRASADGSHTIFVSNGQLHPDAPALGGDPSFRELLLYEHTPAGLDFVCYLPSSVPVSGQCAPGTPSGVRGADQSSDRNAISADGRVIYWSAFSGSVIPFSVLPGTIYARVDGSETVAVSGQIAADPAVYWTAAPDGSKALFSFVSGPHAHELYEFDLASESTTLLATGVIGPMGASEDATRVYFASEDDLDGGGPGTTAENNLYFHDTGAATTTFVMELADADTDGVTQLGAPVENDPYLREAAVSADGMHAAFSAFAPPPSGFENLDVETGERVQEVYRYDAAADDLRCVSCNPTGARAVTESVEGQPVAARIQGWEANGRSPRTISADGSRVFFESIEALVPRDENGTWDVYQWEEPGTGTCKESDPTYGSESGGCIDLISSGESPSKSVFLDADATGDNVFFSTRSRLIAADTDGLNDVYTARVNGGFPDPPPPPEPCEGEGCRDAAPDPPAVPGAATPHFVGPPNPAFKPCARYARRAGALARQAKGLRTRARKAARAAKRSSKPKLTRSLARKARRHAGAAKRRSGAAKRLSSAAKRCRNPQAKSPQASKGARR